MKYLILIFLISCSQKDPGDNLYDIFYDYDIGFYPVDRIRIIESDFYIFNLEEESIVMNAEKGEPIVFVLYTQKTDSTLGFLISNGFNGIDYVLKKTDIGYEGKAYEFWGNPRPYDSTYVELIKVE